MTAVTVGFLSNVLRRKENRSPPLSFCFQYTLHRASLQARERGYPYWKAFTTGKTVGRGGIPHDMYGMTTRSVRGYVTGIQSMLGLDGTKCTKMQTGGPDGDLGSNEIKLGHERTVAIVDGSGVLVDPEGINREELVRLAGIRSPIKEFDVSLLSSKVSVSLKEAGAAVFFGVSFLFLHLVFASHLASFLPRAFAFLSRTMM
jgi:hypothetical protein